MITSLPELYFTFRRFTLLVQMKKKPDELWQLQKQIKTKGISESWLDTYNEGYIYQYQPGSTHKIH